MANPNNPSASNQYPGNRDPWDSLSDFSGERNINSKTGRPRSFTTFDIYPRRPGETSEEYSQRLNRIHEKTVEYQAAEAEKERIAKEKEAREAYLNSEQGQKEAEVTAEFDRLSDKLDQAVAEEKMSKEHAEALKERQLEQATQEIAGYQQDYEDRQSVGTPEEQQAYEEWLKSQEENNTANLRERGITVDDEGRIVRDEKTGESVDNKEIEQIPDKISEINELIRMKEAEQMPGKISEIDELINAKEAERMPDKISELDDLIREKSQQPTENSVKIGEIDIKGIEQKITESKAERIKELEGRLSQITPELGELYAKNRRLINGRENRAAFSKIKGEYGEILDEYLRLKARETYNEGEPQMAEKLGSRIEEVKAKIQESLVDFAGGNLEQSTKTQAELDEEKERLVLEAEEILRSEYKDMAEALESKVNADFLSDYLKQAASLEEATIDKLDNGTLCRRIVNKVINNKAIKGVLIGAAIAGLTVSGIGLAAGVAAGTATIGAGFTAGGVAAGIAKGGVLGGIMSRQNSKNSAIRGLLNEEEIRRNLENTNLLAENTDGSNVASWILEQYDKANIEDKSSNRKRTLIAAGIGAAFGALASGVQVNSVSSGTVTEQGITGYESVEYHPDVDISGVHHEAGTGIENYCVNEAHLVSSPEEFYKPGGLYDIIIQSGQNNGLIEGQSGWSFPGTVDQWSPAAEATMREAINEAARQGVIPATQTGGGPIYGPITKLVENVIPDGFYNELIRVTSGITAAATGGLTGGFRGTSNELNNLQTPDITPGPVAPEPDQSPASEPESTVEEPAAESASEPTPSPEPAPQPEPVAQAASETNSGPEKEPLVPQEYRNRVRTELGSIVGDEGVDIMTAEFPDSAEMSTLYDRTLDFWNSLSDEEKTRVNDFLEQNAQLAQGSYLPFWLEGKRESERINSERAEASQ